MTKESHTPILRVLLTDLLLLNIINLFFVFFIKEYTFKSPRGGEHYLLLLLLFNLLWVIINVVFTRYHLELNRGIGVEIKKILAVNRDWNICIVGFGNLGSAIMQHQNLPARGFKCVAVFDSDSEKIGKKTPTGLKIMDVKDLVQKVKELNIEIGVITTIPSAAQSVADLFLKAKVHAIINFSPGMVRVPDYCVVENIDFTIKLDMLTFKLRQKTAANFNT